MPRRARIHNPLTPLVQKQTSAHHMRQEHDRQHERLNPHRRGYTRKWREVSRAFLQAHPLCAGFDSLCEERGKRTASTDVDHVIPHRGNLRTFWDQDNWQALCHSCHARKTACEDGGFGRPVMGKRDRAASRQARAQHGSATHMGVDRAKGKDTTVLALHKAGKPPPLVTVHGSMKPETAMALARAAIRHMQDMEPSTVLRGYTDQDKGDRHGR